MSYYHTYRPQKFADLVGQDHIRQVLQAGMASGRLAHAYLFSGTRGVGKTTTARLLAKAINCTNLIENEPCNACSLCQAIVDGNCLDIIEIDAASNRGIEEIRQLQDQARFKPQQAKKKIFIIDEAHMLTKEAFNALLKTLEEPPEYLMFILATTEPHKLPPTILSRCQRFEFRSPSQAVLSIYLQRIVKSEKLKAEESALVRLAQLSEGSFRDSATLLEQLATSGEPISNQLIETLLGLPAYELVDRYLRHLDGEFDQLLLHDLQSYFDRGGSPTAFVDSVFLQLESNLKKALMPQQLAAVVGTLIRIKYQLRFAPSGQLPILAALYPASANFAVAVPPEASAPIASTRTLVPVLVEPANPSPIPKEPKSDKISDSAEALPSLATITVEVAQQIPPAKLPDTQLSEYWHKVIGKLLEEGQSSLVAVLRTAQPLSWNAPRLSLAVQFQFHVDQLGRQKNRAILETTLSQILGEQVIVEMEVRPADDLTSAAEELSL